MRVIYSAQRQNYTKIERAFALRTDRQKLVSLIMGFCTCRLLFIKGYLEFTWHNELRSVHTDEGIHATEDQNGQDDGKVADQLPHLERRTLFSPFSFHQN